VTSLTVEVERPAPGVLVLAYTLTGDLAALRIPEPVTSARAEDLWRHTCFEAFLKPIAGETYFEVNVSPSGQWAIYRFDGYRAGMASPPTATPTIETQISANTLECRVSLNLDFLLGRAVGQVWELGIAAVVEDAEGRIAHWALTHPPGRADFHHADGFALELAP
jgi:hypothetical protein